MAFGGPPSLQPSHRSNGRSEDLPSISPVNYQSETERRRSFGERALNGINPDKLARAGFFYTGEKKFNALNVGLHMGNGNKEIFHLISINSVIHAARSFKHLLVKENCLVQRWYCVHMHMLLHQNARGG